MDTRASSGPAIAHGCMSCDRCGGHCPICHPCPLNVPSVYPQVTPTTRCEHCFCISSEVQGRAHKTCCMCGHRMVIGFQMSEPWRQTTAWG